MADEKKTEQVEQQENKMGVMPVNKLLLSMAIPMMISMLVQALYNVVDSIFVSRIAENALTAISMAFPMQNLMISFAVGFGVGINALLSRALGEKDSPMANRVAANGVLLEFLSYLLFMILGLTVVVPYMRFQTQVEEIVQYGVEYLRICMIGSCGLFAQVTFERLLQSTGRTQLAMVSQLVGAIINIIFDPILIFGLFGFPALGIAGAAYATIGGQIVGAIVGGVLNHKKNTEIHLRLKGYRPEREMIGAISRISIPSIIMSSISSVMTYIFDLILVGFSTTAVAVFGVYFKLQSFVFMPIFGLNNGMVPIIAYNYGARQPERIKKTIKLSMLYAVIIMFLGFTLIQLIPDKLLLLFDASEDMLTIGVPALRIIATHFILAGISIIASSSCQAFGFGMYSLYVSIARQLVVLIPVAYLLSLTGVLNDVWLSFPIAELVSIVLGLFFLRRVFVKVGMAKKKT